MIIVNAINSKSGLEKAIYEVPFKACSAEEAIIKRNN
jgi:hypothetical protein